MISKSELLQEKTSKLEHYKLDITKQSTQLKQRLAKELRELKEKGSQQLQELQWKAEKEKREIENKNAGLLYQLANRVASLDVQNRDLVENTNKQEASLREAMGQLKGIRWKCLIKGKKGNGWKFQEGIEIEGLLSCHPGSLWWNKSW